MKKHRTLGLGATVTAILMMLSTLPSFTSASVEVIVEVDPLDPFAQLVAEANADVISLRQQRYGRRMEKNSKGESASGKDGGKLSTEGIKSASAKSGNKQSKQSASSQGSRKGSKKSASGQQPDEGEEVVEIDGANFSAARIDAPPLVKTVSSPRSDSILKVPLTLPDIPTDVFLRTEGDNPNGQVRTLQDIPETCDDPENELIGEDLTGIISVLIPGDVDSSIILCNNNTVIAVYYRIIDAINDDDIDNDDDGVTITSTDPTVEPTPNPTVFMPFPIFPTDRPTSSPEPTSPTASPWPTQSPEPTGGSGGR